MLGFSRTNGRFLNLNYYFDSVYFHKIVILMNRYRHPRSIVSFLIMAMNFRTLNAEN